ncbi:MAG: sensor histidine kinase [Ilumatobacteraceae bacterium]
MIGLVLVWFVTVAVAVAIGRRIGAQRLDDPGRVGWADSAEPAVIPTAGEVLEELRLGVAISGRDGVGEFRNAAIRSMAGTHAGVVLGDAVERHLARGLVGIRSDEVVELYGPPRSVFIVRSAPLPSGGAVVFVDDVSERRRIDQVRTDFVANVSHELKTPVGALFVLAETLQDELGLDEPDLATVRRLADRMPGEAERAARTIDDLMELSRIEMGGDRLVEAVPIAEVVDAAVARVRELARRTSIAIEVDLSGADGVVLAGDRRQLVSAVGNLVENAVKYSEPDASVSIRAVGHDTDLLLEITDQGSGIPAADVERVFERFYRVDPARSRSTGGTGLGLSIVRNVVTQHGGRVSVRSVEGSGSTFTVVLPLPVDDLVDVEAVGA